MKCEICNGTGVLEIEDDSEYGEGFCDCGNCGGTGNIPEYLRSESSQDPMMRGGVMVTHDVNNPE